LFYGGEKTVLADISTIEVYFEVSIILIILIKVFKFI